MGHARLKPSVIREVVRPWQTATVVALQADGSVSIQLDGQTVLAAMAAHLPAPMPGQRVLVAQAPDAPLLVVAAYPRETATASAVAPEVLSYDAETGTLSIHAAQLKLQSIASIEIRCGEAVLRFNAQGEVFMQAQAITQAAIGPYLIEGASIDLN